jgi:DNA-binding MarR family transcriptional regulator
MKPSEFKEMLDRDPAFMGKMALDLATLIARQAEAVYEARAMEFPVIVSSALLYLAEVGPASLTEIAQGLDHSHQLVKQRVDNMLKLGLIRGRRDRGDGRRTLFSLTAEGIMQAERLKEYRCEAARVFTALSDEIGVNLADVLPRACEALERTPLAARFPAYGPAQENAERFDQ